MLKKLFVLTLFGTALGTVGAAEFYVAPNGQSTGTGTRDRPLDLQTAISRSSPARGGDTIWMLGGTYFGNYTSYLGGGVNNHITLRGYPGEQATLDGANASLFPLVVDGAWAIYRDFEVIQSSTWVAGAPTPVGIQCVAPNVKLINLVIHDAGMGIGCWMGAHNAEIYGCLIYNNGSKSLEHGIYTQNDVLTGTKRIHDNIIFNNSGFGVHAYTQGGKLTGFDFQGNIAFNNGSKNGDSTRYENIFVGGAPPADQINVVSNYTFTTLGLSRYNVRFSYQNHQDEPQGRITASDNYIVGGTGFTADDYRQMVFTNNMVATPSQLTHCWPPPGVAISSYLWNFNEYHGASSLGVGSANYNFDTWRATTSLDAASSYSSAMPRGVKVFVRANKHQAKRANIAVYNWDSLPRVSVDVAGVLALGDQFEVRNAQDFYGPPVLTGTFAGAPLSLPATNLAVALPKGRTIGPAPTGPLFNAFVLIGNPGTLPPPPPNNTPPTISVIPDQTLAEDSSSASVPFTIGDAETSAAGLAVSATSSNPSVVPDVGVVLSGSGASRAVRITPGVNRSGTANITITVFDGYLSATRAFGVNVTAVNDAPTISSIPDQTSRKNGPTAAIPFTVGDPEGSALTVSASSSNPALVPQANIVVGGSGANRTITLYPLPEQTGTTLVTLTVSDGSLTATRAFQLTVTADTGPATTYISVAADSGVLTSPMSLGTDTTSGENFIRTSTFGQGTARYNFSVPTAGDYLFWCRIQAPDSTADSFVVSVDGTGDDIYDVAEGSWAASWQWTRLNGRAGGNPLTLNPRIFTLAAGNHQILFTGRDVNTRLSRFIVTNDRDYVPSDSTISISNIPDQTTPANVTISSVPFSIVAAGVPPDAVVLSVQSSNPSLIPTANIAFSGSGLSRTLSLTPVLNQTGSSIITVSASDGRGASASETFLFVVASVNASPTLNALNNVSLNEDAGAQVVNLAGISAGSGENQALTVTATSSNPALIPAAVVSYATPSANGSLSITPVANASGSATISVTINDGQALNNTVTRTFNVTVAAVNDLPTISAIAAQSTLPNQPVNGIPFTVGDAETAAGSLTVSAVASDATLLPQSGIVFAGSGANRTLNLSPAANRSGTTSVTVTVRDADNGTRTTSFTLAVTAAPNVPPTLNALNNVSLNEDAGAQVVNLAGISAGSGENQALTVTATSSNPALIPAAVVSYATPSANGSLSITPVANASGSATISVTINDGQALNNTVTRTLNVTVAAVNDLPTISAIAARSTSQNQAVSIPFSIGDVETAASSLTPSAVATDATLLPSSGIVFGGSGVSRSINLTPAVNRSGTTTVTITVRDADNGTVSTSFTLAVTSAANVAPTLAALSNLSISEDAGTQVVNLSGISAGSGENQNLTITATSSNPSLIPTPAISYASPSANGSLSFTTAANGSGSATVTVTVNDGQAQNNTVTRSFSVTVAGVNDLPTISAIADQVIPINQAVAGILVMLGDVETSASALTWTVSTSNQGLLPIGNVVLSGSGSSRFLAITPVRNQTGNATIQLRVADAEGAVSTRTFVVTVHGANLPPVVSAGAALLAEPNQAVALQGIVQDDGPLNTLQITWEKVSGTGTVTFANSTVAATTATFSQPGRYQLRLRANDGQLSSLSTVVVQVGLASVPRSPTISGVYLDPYSRNQVSIRWNTDVAADSQVEYGRTTSYGQLSSLDSSMATSHRVDIYNLAGETPYHFRIRTRNAQGLLKISGDYAFTTPRNKVNNPFTPAAPTSPAAPRLVSVRRLSGGRAEVIGVAQPGTTCAVRVSLELQRWITIGTVVADSNGILRFEDPSFADFGIRFYRFGEL